MTPTLIVLNASTLRIRHGKPAPDVWPRQNTCTQCVWPCQNTSTHMQLAGRNSAEHVQLDDGAGRQADITFEVQSRPLRNDGVG